MRANYEIGGSGVFWEWKDTGRNVKEEMEEILNA